MKDYFSDLYLKLARYDLEIGIKTFHEIIEELISKVVYDKTDLILLYKIFSNFSDEMDYGEQAFIIGSYISGKLQVKRPEVPKIKSLSKMSKKYNI